MFNYAHSTEHDMMYLVNHGLDTCVPFSYKDAILILRACPLLKIETVTKPSLHNEEPYALKYSLSITMAS